MKCPKNHPLPNIIGGVSCAPDQCAEDNVPLFSRDKRTEKKALAKKESTKAADELARAKTQAIRKEITTKTESVIETALEGSDLLWAAKTDAAAARVEEIAKLGHKIGRHEALRLYTGTPDSAKLTQEERKGYVDKKLDELTVDAIARVEYDLKLGDEDVSRKMALEVLDRTGYGKKEALAQAGAPIIIVNQGGETYRPPWERTVNGDAKK